MECHVWKGIKYNHSCLGSSITHTFLKAGMMCFLFIQIFSVLRQTSVPVIVWVWSRVLWVFLCFFVPVWLHFSLATCTFTSVLLFGFSLFAWLPVLLWKCYFIVCGFLLCCALCPDCQHLCLVNLSASVSVLSIYFLFSHLYLVCLPCFLFYSLWFCRKIARSVFCFFSFVLN